MRVLESTSGETRSPAYNQYHLVRSIMTNFTSMIRCTRCWPHACGSSGPSAPGVVQNGHATSDARVGGACLIAFLSSLVLVVRSPPAGR